MNFLGKDRKVLSYERLQDVFLEYARGTIDFLGMKKIEEINCIKAQIEFIVLKKQLIQLKSMGLVLNEDVSDEDQAQNMISNGIPIETQYNKDIHKRLLSQQLSSLSIQGRQKYDQEI